MAEVAVEMLAATVESLYVSSTPAPIGLTAEVVLLAFGIGVAVALLSVPVERVRRAREAS